MSAASAWLHYRGSRPLGWIALATLALFLLGVRALWVEPVRAARVFFWASLILPFALAAGAVSRDRRSSRWLLVFQAPVTPLRHYGWVLGFILACALGLQVMGALVLSLASLAADAPQRLVWGALLAASLWTVVLTLLVFTLSVLLPRYDGAAAALYAGAGFGQVVIFEDVGLGPGRLRGALSWLLLPLDALAEAWRALLGSGGPLPPEGWIRIVVFAGAAAALSWAGLVRLGRAELPSRDG